MPNKEGTATAAVLNALVDSRIFIALNDAEAPGLGRHLEAALPGLFPEVGLLFAALREHPLDERLTIAVVAARILGKEPAKNGVDDVELLLDSLTAPGEGNRRVVLILEGAERLKADSFGFLRLAADMVARPEFQWLVVFLGNESFPALLRQEDRRLAALILPPETAVDETAVDETPEAPIAPSEPERPTDVTPSVLPPSREPVRSSVAALAASEPLHIVLSGRAQAPQTRDGSRIGLAIAIGVGALLILGAKVAHSPGPPTEKVGSPAPEPLRARHGAAQPADENGVVARPSPMSLAWAPIPVAMIQAASVMETSVTPPTGDAEKAEAPEDHAPQVSPEMAGGVPAPVSAPEAKPEVEASETATALPVAALEPAPPMTPSADTEVVMPPEPPAPPVSATTEPVPSAPPLAPPAVTVPEPETPVRPVDLPATPSPVPPQPVDIPAPPPGPVVSAPEPPAPPVEIPVTPPPPPPVEMPAPPPPVVAAPEPPAAPIAPAVTPPSPPPVFVPAAPIVLPPAVQHPAPPSGPSVVSPAMVDLLQRRGDEMLATGDISAARRLYERVASQSGRAAFALGRSYDPRILASLRVSGVTGDAAVAAQWYHRALDLGHAEARVALEQLQAAPVTAPARRP